MKWEAVKLAGIVKDWYLLIIIIIIYFNIQKIVFVDQIVVR